MSWVVGVARAGVPTTGVAVDVGFGVTAGERTRGSLPGTGELTR